LDENVTVILSEYKIYFPFRENVLELPHNFTTTTVLWCIYSTKEQRLSSLWDYWSLYCVRQR